MGVIYKLKDEVVQFIISQRQSNPLFSCRQLAESASEKFSLHLSKSSVHDVLKESGIITARGRKPKAKFTIPEEKKQQIQSSLAQVNLLLPNKEVRLLEDVTVAPPMEISAAYEGAGKVFLKAVHWDLGIFSDEPIKESDWGYLLTYSKGIQVNLENSKSFFIDLVLPIERCIREVADGLINNIKVFIVHKTSDEALLKASMEAQPGSKILNIRIVGCLDHIILELSNIVEYKRNYKLKNRLFVESSNKESLERLKSLFFTQVIDNNSLTEYFLNLKGFDTVNKDEKIVNLLLPDGYDKKSLLQEAMERLNEMYLRDEQARLVSIRLADSL